MIKMLLSLLSLVAVTLAYPQRTIDGNTLLTYPTSKSSTSTTIQKDIASNFTESVREMRDSGKCQCVPYFLCYEDDRVYEPSTTLWFDSVCEDIMDLCCKNPKPTPIPKVKKGCGYRNLQGLHSVPSKNSEMPWMVALMVDGTTVGAGALVHPQVVLTAAHVPDKYSDSKLTVRAGEWHTQTDKQRLKSQERSVENIKMHKDFIKTNLMNDVALIRLQTPMELSDHINVVCLPDQDEDFDHSRGCIVNGWKKEDSGAVTLKKVEADILDPESCNAKLKSTRLGKWFRLDKSFVCAEERQGFTCRGDGGAPLVCPGVEAYKVTGLVAWGIGCGDDVPAVYARVSMFREWIDNTMREWGFGDEEWF